MIGVKMGPEDGASSGGWLSVSQELALLRSHHAWKFCSETGGGKGGGRGPVLGALSLYRVVCVIWALCTKQNLSQLLLSTSPRGDHHIAMRRDTGGSDHTREQDMGDHVAEEVNLNSRPGRLG